LNIIIKPIWIFFIDRNVQLAVGNESYGFYAALLNFTIIFNIILDMGISNYNAKHLAQQQQHFSLHFPNMFLAKVLLSLIYFSFLMIFLNIFNYSHHAITFVLVLGLIQFLNSLLTYFRSFISAFLYLKTDAFFSILDKLIMILGCGFLLVFYTISIYDFIHIQLLAYFLSCLIAFLFIQFKIKKTAYLKINFIDTKKIILNSFPYAVLIFLMAIYMRSDTILIERLLGHQGAHSAGTYMLAFRILDVANMFGFLFAGMLLPLFSKFIFQEKNITDLVESSSNLLLPISFAISINGFFYGNEIMSFLYQQHTISNLGILYSLLLASFPAYCLIHIYSTLLTANSNIKILINISLFGAFASLMLNYFLIPKYGYLGAAYTNLVVIWLVSILYVTFCFKKINLSISKITLLKYLFIIIIFILVNYFFKQAQFSVISSISASIIIFIPLLYISKLWDVEKLKKYFNDFSVDRK
ncbi:MAG: oligosaccharide flippase family protein, partial [Chitinophagaceae bacterium]|nr:oligosaccharide flippase family protein [Chitinophagaceae bacterium]